MSKKLMLLAVAAVSAAMLVVPAMASAAGWDIDPSPISFTSKSSGTTKLTTAGQAPVECLSSTGTGSYTTATTGKITLKFHSCTTNVPFFGTQPCTGTLNANEPSGTITTTELEFHNIYIEPNKTTPGILITSNNGHFATFKCFGVTTVVNGNGIIGDITTPKCGEESTTSTIDFESTSAGQQKYKQAETTGTSFDLTASTGGGAAETASQDGEGTITFAAKAKMTCT